ncbi:MAG: hypothetical protein U9Q62_10625 [Campylobacterota bacterium]|nr:hypothetical protein [Campylobacterota bacterium]
MMKHEAMLNQLGYAPNEALLGQLERIIDNTASFEKIQKHIFELHKALKVDDSFVAMSNSNDHFKIKLEAPSQELKEEAYAKVMHFADKYKVKLQKVDGKDTYYIIGFAK